MFYFFFFIQVKLTTSKNFLYRKRFFVYLRFLWWNKILCIKTLVVLHKRFLHKFLFFFLIIWGLKALFSVLICLISLLMERRNEKINIRIVFKPKDKHWSWMFLSLAQWNLDNKMLITCNNWEVNFFSLFETIIFRFSCTFYTMFWSFFWTLFSEFRMITTKAKTPYNYKWKWRLKFIVFICNFA